MASICLITLTLLLLLRACDSGPGVMSVMITQDLQDKQCNGLRYMLNGEQCQAVIESRCMGSKYDAGV